MKDENITTRKCPEAFCNGRLVVRTNRSTEEQFIGCENYPKCTYTEPIEVDDGLMGVKDAASVWE